MSSEIDTTVQDRWWKRKRNCENGEFIKKKKKKIRNFDFWMLIHRWHSLPLVSHLDRSSTSYANAFIFTFNDTRLVPRWLPKYVSRRSRGRSKYSRDSRCHRPVVKIRSQSRVAGITRLEKLKTKGYWKFRSGSVSRQRNIISRGFETRLESKLSILRRPWLWGIVKTDVERAMLSVSRYFRADSKPLARKWRARSNGDAILRYFTTESIHWRGSSFRKLRCRASIRTDVN